MAGSDRPLRYTKMRRVDAPRELWPGAIARFVTLAILVTTATTKLWPGAIARFVTLSARRGSGR